MPANVWNLLSAAIRAQFGYPRFALHQQNGQDDEQAGEAYAWLLLTDEGQKLIKKAGFIPIRWFWNWAIIMRYVLVGLQL